MTSPASTSPARTRVESGPVDPDPAKPVAVDPAPTDRRTVLLVFAGLLVAMLLGSLDQTMFSTALPTIVGELDGVDHMLWVTTAYMARPPS